MQALRILILGGTTEASALAHLLARDLRFNATLSLAGRTAEPSRHPVQMRIGGFGGVPGLTRYLTESHIDAIIDATHPFAAQIKQNVTDASRATGIPLLAIARPPWVPVPGDTWTSVADTQAASGALGPMPLNVFLTVGRQDLAPFQNARQHHYLIRSVDAPDAELLPPDARVITARGPFSEPEERRVLQEHAIDVIVTKNSGGTATRAKLDAARALSIPVIMVDRPATPKRDTVATAEEAWHWLGCRHACSPAERGV